MEKNHCKQKKFHRYFEFNIRRYRVVVEVFFNDFNMHMRKENLKMVKGTVYLYEFVLCSASQTSIGIIFFRLFSPWSFTSARTTNKLVKSEFIARYEFI